jgi:hypothetical protein
MGRNKEGNDSFRVRMDSAKREYLAGEIISQGYYFTRDGEKLPSFGRFLEDVADSLKKATPIDTALNVVYSYRKSRNKQMLENSLEQHLVDAKAAALDSFTSQLFEILEARGFQSDEFLLSLSRYFGEEAAAVLSFLEKAAMALKEEKGGI